jgi:hypothetical protein
MFTPMALAWHPSAQYRLHPDTEIDPTDTFDETFIRQVWSSVRDGERCTY